MSNAAAPENISTNRGIKPSVGWLTVNRECNMRCEFCYAKGTNYDPTENMSLETALKLMSAMKSVGVTNLTLIGGEPTLWNPLFEFIDEAKRVGMKTTLVTNATRLGNDSFWNAYRENPCTRTNLSIKAFDEESYRCATGHSNFQITKTGISRALELDSSRASVVYTGENPEEIIALARFAASCGAKSIGISPATPAYVNGAPESEFLVHPERFVRGIVENYDELDQIFAGKFSVSVKLPLCMWPRTLIKKMMERSQIYTSCQLQHRSGLIFDVHGKLLSCNSLPDFPIGQWGREFSDDKSLLKHIGSAPVVKFYDRLSTYASSQCVTCSVKHLCGGGCPLFYGVYEGRGLIKGWDVGNVENVQLDGQYSNAGHCS